MEDIQRLEELYMGAADRRQVDLAERIGLFRYQSRRAKAPARIRLFGRDSSASTPF